MALDPDFTKQTTELIVQTLELYQKAGASPRVGETWDCENVGRFFVWFFCWGNGRIRT